jgi:HlyD family secretion protein
MHKHPIMQIFPTPDNHGSAQARPLGKWLTADGRMEGEAVPGRNGVSQPAPEGCHGYVRRRTRCGAMRPLPVLLLSLLAVAVISVPAYRRLKTSAPGTIPVFQAARGLLEITVTESGTISPSEQITLKSELEGRSTILYLIREGSQVKAGDLLVELDATNLEARRIEQGIRVQNSEAAFIRSRETLEVVKNQAQSDVEKATLDLQFAREDLDKYKAGEYPNKLKELDARITLAREEKQRAEQKLKWSQVLFKEKYLSESEIQADELSVKKAALDVELAENTLNLLRQFEYKRQIAKLESDARQAEMALERATRKARADVIQAEADLRAKESEFTQNQSQLEKLIVQIGKARITAPRDGLVVYATSVEVRWRGSSEPLAEGQEVRERQELIYLPTASSFIAKIKIHESSLQKVRRDMPVSLRADALPGMAFKGRVNSIAPLPDAMSAFMNPDLKLYDTEIRIEGGGEVLRTGMNCEVTIHVASYPDAIHVPVQCVVRINRQPVVFVDTPAGPVKREVTIGEDNNRMVHIIAGLEPGEPVLLAPPLDAAGGKTDVADKEDDRVQADGNSDEPPPLPEPWRAGEEPGKPRANRAPKDGAERRQRQRPSQEQP